MDLCLCSAGALTCCPTAAPAARSDHSAIMSCRRKRLDVEAVSFVAAIPTLRVLGISYGPGVTDAAVEHLRTTRPDLTLDVK